MSNTEKRRVTDQVQQQIEELIVAATDPKDKAFLLIMNKIAQSLDTNTYLTQGLSDEFKVHTAAFRAHEAQEQKLVNQSRGGVRVGLYLLGIIQVLVWFILSQQLDELTQVKNKLVEVNETVKVHTERLNNLTALRH